jgi:hypothetical protein
VSRKDYDTYASLGNTKTNNPKQNVKIVSDCKSAGLRLRWFESITYHHLQTLRQTPLIPLIYNGLINIADFRPCAFLLLGSLGHFHGRMLGKQPQGRLLTSHEKVVHANGGIIGDQKQEALRIEKSELSCHWPGNMVLSPGYRLFWFQGRGPPILAMPVSPR